MHFIKVLCGATCVVSAILGTRPWLATGDDYCFWKSSVAWVVIWAAIAVNDIITRREP
jgi:hypothetical protein